MKDVIFRFYGSLNDFLPNGWTQVAFSHPVLDHASIKDAIESLGVPHPEIDLIIANGNSVDFSYCPQSEDRVSVYPCFHQIDVCSLSQVHSGAISPTFVLDVHLGKLARYLRLLGFDTLYCNTYRDEELAEISNQESRILLTQDRGLLKRTIVTHGYIVRSPNPKRQLQEVMDRYHLYDQVTPFCRCPQCNGLSRTVEKQAVYDRLPHYTRLSYDEFFECQDCHQLYWKGAHFRRLQQFVQQFTAPDRSIPKRQR